MSAAYDFTTRLADLVPIFTAAPGGDREFHRPLGWSSLTMSGNADRIGAWKPGHAVMALMGGPVAVLDVDTKNGADVEKIRATLDGLGVRVFADVLTPSGGRHFYVAGHPDLPTVHAREGRDGLTGHPGVEVISHGANVFAPGTTRAKYGGDGYVVLDNNLDALADGGDPDGAESMVGWVAERRVTTKRETFTPAEPWTGTPPDERQAAYLAATLRNLSDRIAAMPTDSGRNTALFNAAMTCGNYIAGAGMDEAQAVEQLRDGAARCGLVAEDGEPSVLATIASGLRNGKQAPRTVPEAPDPHQAPTTAPEPPPITGTPATAAEALRKAHATFARWLGEDYDLDALDATLAAAAVERLDGDPLWLLLVSGSGNAKTETVQALDGIGATVASTIASEGALLSATSQRERTSGATGGLLRQIGDRGVLVIKDVTSILSMSRDQRGQVLGAVREVYDGRWNRSVGTDGGRTLSWSGRIVLVGAVTTAWDTAHAVVATMGDRFVLLRMDSTTGRQGAGRKAIGNTGSEVRMRAELAAAVADVLDAMTTPEDVTEAETDALLSAADLVTLARTGVEYDYRGDVIDAHAPEMPTRFAKQLAQVVRGASAIGLDRTNALRLAIRCGRDSMPPLRLELVDDLGEHPDSTTAQVRKRLSKPRATVDRQLQALHMLGVLECDEEETEWAGKPATRWHYRLTDGIDPDALRVKSVPEMSVPTPNPQREEGEREGRSRPPTDKSGTDPAEPPRRVCSTCPASLDLEPPGIRMCRRCAETLITRARQEMNA